MNAPRFSIVIPVHNRARYLPEAVQSALAQEHEEYEVLVVDDGSTDGGPEAVESLDSEILRVMRLPHSGAPAARNAGVQEARGEFIVWLDSDDVLEPGTLRDYARVLAACPDADVLYGRVHLTNGDLEPVRTIEFEDWHRRNRHLLNTLLFRCPLPHPGTAVAKRCYELAGGYDERFKRAHDYEFWTRLALKAVFKYIPRPVCRWRWHDANMSSGSVAVDTRYELEVVRGLLAAHPLERLFPEATSDRKEKIIKLAERLRGLGDPESAARIEAQTLDRMEHAGEEPPVHWEHGARRG